MSVVVQNGFYEKGLTTEANSLVANLNKYPEISRVLTDLYPQYQFYWLFERLNMFAGTKANKDNSYEWKVRGRLDQPSIVATGDANGGASSGTASAYETGANYSDWDPAADSLNPDEMFMFKVSNNPANDEHVWANPNDMIMFQSGAIMIVWSIVGTGTFTTANSIAIGAGEAGLICKSIYGKPTAADLAAGATVANIGDAYGEGSYGGYQNKVRETTKRNWLTKTRRAYDITGDAMTNVSWLNYDGQKLWFYQEENDTEKIFKYQFEKRIRYARTSMTVAGAPSNGDVAGSHTYPGGGGSNKLSWKDNGDLLNSRAPEIGDGLYAQFSGKNEGSYSKSAGMSEEGLQNYVAKLAQNSSQGAEDNEWLVLASSFGRVQFSRAMKELIISAAAGGSFAELSTGRDIALGANFTTYHTNGNKFTLVHDYTLDDPHIYGTGLTLGSGGTATTLSGTGDLIFVNFNRLNNGEANVQLLSKQKRSYITKYITGMMDPYTQESNGSAANGFDGFSREWLAHSGVILRNDLTCGFYRAIN